MIDCVHNRRGICVLDRNLECEGCTHYAPYDCDLCKNQGVGNTCKAGPVGLCSKDYIPKTIDEFGGDLTPKSLKFDSGKLRFDLIPPEITTALAEVLTYGCKKYEANSWQGISRERYVAATYRHFVSWQNGETLDPESGLHHLSHVLCNVAFLLFKDNHKIV